MNTKETIEERIDRLELYISFLRDIAVNHEEYALWDWMISKKLNREQCSKIKDTLKFHVRSLIDAEDNKNVPELTNLTSQLGTILSITIKDVDDNLIKELLRNAIKMPAYKRLNQYLNLMNT
ncbi:hypothetical protein [Paenibacillus jiagnxiensis]|uniref:hypothetical protein n=1 Tax=Paenibacillus jiagnxiensis TaxID=3228926 RepID=UPI0033B4BC31